MKTCVMSKVPKIDTCASQVSLPTPLSNSQAYVPAASILSELRTSRMQEVSVVITLYR